MVEFCRINLTKEIKKKIFGPEKLTFRYFGPNHTYNFFLLSVTQVPSLMKCKFKRNACEPQVIYCIPKPH
jgi:hypothetical protein